jgi:hypothetical protein
MQRSFDPRRATLVVVSPDEPHGVLATVERAFSRLPRASRALPSSPPTTRAAEGPRELPSRRRPGATRRDGARASRLVAAVHTTLSTGDIVGDEESVVLARVLCGVLNRQRPTALPAGATDLPSTTGTATARAAANERVRCTAFEDPRRPLLVVDVTSTRPAREVLRERLARITSGTDAALLDAQRARQRASREHESQAPLGLARALARSAPVVAGNPDEVQQRPWAGLVGLASLADPNGVQRVLGGLLDADQWWQLVEPADSQAPPTGPAPEAPATSEGGAGTPGDAPSTGSPASPPASPSTAGGGAP